METGTLPNSRGYTFLVHKFGAYQLLDIARLDLFVLKIGLTYILINYYDTVIRNTIGSNLCSPTIDMLQIETAHDVPCITPDT